MSVLLLLAERPGEVITSEEIIEKAWGGRPVADNPVYKTINKLRRALDDDPRNPRYIATVTKRGYRLVAPISALAAEPTQSGSDEPGRPASGRPASGRPASAGFSNTAAVGAGGRRYWLFATIAAVLLTVAGIAIVMSGTAAPATFEQVVTLPGDNGQPSVAPDGRRIAFVNTNPEPAIWIRRADGTSYRLTAGTHPDWSGAGDQILFQRGGDTWLQTPSVDSKPERLIERATHAAWSFDGSHIVFERDEEVWIADARGLEQRRVPGIASRTALFAPRLPRFSPDGRRLVYFQTLEGPLGDIWTIDLATNEVTRITSDVMQAGHPTFTLDGRWIVYSSARGGAQSLWRAAADGSGQMQQLTFGSGSDEAPSINPRSQSIVYESTRPRWSVVLTDPALGTEANLFESRFPVLAPELSPDGSRIAFFAVDTRR